MKIGGRRLRSLLTAVLLLSSVGLVVSCSSDDKKKDTTTGPTGGGTGGGGGSAQCVRAVECPKGGWIDACANTSGCAYYHLSDGSNFNCTNCSSCDTAAQQAVDRCMNSL